MADVQKALAAFGIQDDGTYYDITNNVAVRLNGGGSVRYVLASTLESFIPLH